MNNEWDHIRSMKATFEDWVDGKKVGERTYQGIQAWGALVVFGKPYAGVPKIPLLPRIPKKRKPKGYKGAPKLKRLPATKENYRSKNAAGGRKAVFSQSREYKLKDWRDCAIPWYEWKPNEPI